MVLQFWIFKEKSLLVELWIAKSSFQCKTIYTKLLTSKTHKSQITFKLENNSSNLNSIGNMFSGGILLPMYCLNFQSVPGIAAQYIIHFHEYWCSIIRCDKEE